MCYLYVILCFYPNGLLALCLARDVFKEVTDRSPDGQHVTGGGDDAQLNQRTDYAVRVFPARHNG
jgi:hypothetical protein